MLIAQITDPHAGVRIAVGGEDIDTLYALQRAVSHLNALRPRPDVVVVTGDLVAEEHLDNYRSVASTLGALDMPCYVIPGNHDDRALIREVFRDRGYVPEDGEFLHYAVEDFDLRIVALDTHDPGQAGGLLCPARLAWLDTCLARAPQRPTFVIMHHPPFDTGIQGFDAIGLTGRESFGEVVSKHTQIQAIACGHVHRDISLRWSGTLVTVSPATGYQYALQLASGAVLAKIAEPPAARLFHWNPTVGLTSHISYIPA